MNEIITKNSKKELSTFEKVERNKSINLERLGETRMMNCGEIAFIVEYNNINDITVQFKSTNELVKCQYHQFKRGNVKSHFSPTVYGMGIVGLEATVDKNGDSLISYICWKNLLMRAYSDKYHKKQPTYVGVTVCDDWLYYRNFKVWYHDNYYELPELGRTEVDKDFLSGENKIYSPQTCVFVPSRINSLITKSGAIRGDLPIGVVFDKTHEKYIASCNNINKKRQYLGLFDTPEEAFITYKTYKENLIKQLANEYKNQLPTRLYEAMLKYKVLITD